ncbi:SufE family protein [Bradyrhizobium betae]|uniref:SufE family protein n=1 Tax=Bradyrhizobium betae TaxID=244734 RepID=UPI003D675012
MTTPQQPALSIDDIVENFALLDEWDDRYRYVIELGRKLDPFPEQDRNEVNKVRGCASQVWLATTVCRSDDETVLTFMGDSDAHIVRGLVAILIALLSGRPAREIANENPIVLFERLGLGEHLTPQRSNGFRSMVERIRADARGVLSDAVELASMQGQRREPSPSAPSRGHA